MVAAAAELSFRLGDRSAVRSGALLGGKGRRLPVRSGHASRCAARRRCLAGNFQHLRSPDRQPTAGDDSLSPGRRARRRAPRMVCRHRVQRAHTHHAAARGCVTAWGRRPQSRARPLPKPPAARRYSCHADDIHRRIRRGSGRRRQYPAPLGARSAQRSAHAERPVLPADGQQQLGQRHGGERDARTSHDRGFGAARTGDVSSGCGLVSRRG